ncbi:NADPH-dependent FMN reductase [Rhodococcus sp. LB1]|uniref:NADPH-dependent FMN reductase n=1 Tax=Rhodococcus sp. LB1 TaxID=1807499 RepID=UPI00077A08F3|nr:NAD(P)H-dependent oxidoreductase [Rhodococcus sp. LB1]KXX55881.1 NADPH-dependent FMN reductase [Rhodococcus sp. LB1]
MSSPTLQVIIGSTRPVRAGAAVAAWFADVARADSGFTVETVDLTEVGLPLLDEPGRPMLGRYVHQHTRDWSATISRGDAFVVVPEYNHGYNAATKNAIDYLWAEWRDKPVGFVSYGGLAAGTRAVQGLRQVFLALKAHPVSEAVVIANVAQLIEDGATVAATEGMKLAAKTMLDELARRNTAMRRLRAPKTADGRSRSVAER